MFDVCLVCFCEKPLVFLNLVTINEAREVHSGFFNQSTVSFWLLI